MARYDKEEKRESYADDKPELAIDILADEITSLRQKMRHKFPHEFPRGPLPAAGWWMSHQKPWDEATEKPRRVSVTGSQAKRWINPYADRLVVSLRAYCRLAPHEREFVIAAIEDGVWYNGDSFEFFQKVYEETQRMRKIGARAYRAEAVQKLKSLVGRIS